MGSSVILPGAGQPATGADPSFKTASKPNIVSFGFEAVAPPSGVYVQRDDVIVLRAVSQLANEIVGISVRTLQPFNLSPGQPDHPPGGAAGSNPQVGPGYVQTVQSFLQLGAALTVGALALTPMEGYLLGVGLGGTNSFVRGQTFARVVLVRGNFVSGNTQPLSNVLVADYCSVLGTIGWPGGRTLSPADGPGLMVRYNPANPGVGADFNFTTNNPGRVRLAGFKATLVTSAVAGNRFPSFFVQPQPTPGPSYQVQDPVAVPASTTITYSLAPDVANVRGGGGLIFATLPLASQTQNSGSIAVGSSTFGLLGGDQWSVISVDTEEWLDKL